ncbi:MAG: hypothetical protein ABJD24_05315 [Acidimicrobiales bacterium]
MSDFDATPIDEQASDLLDDNGTADNNDPAVVARVRQFASQKAAIADVDPPAPAVRERLVAAALAAAPESNVIPLRRRPILAVGAGLVAAAAAASLIFVVSNRHNDSRLSSATGTTAAATAGAAPQVKAADTAAATEAAAATTTAAASAAAPAATAFAGALADRSYNSPQELVTAYQAARDALAAPPPATTVSPTCSFAGERIGSITYQDTPAELFVTTDSFGHAHLTALAIEDCHRVIEVAVP